MRRAGPGRHGAQFDGFGGVGSAGKLEPVAEDGGVVDEPCDGGGDDEGAGKPEGARAQLMTAKEGEADGDPGEERENPAVVAGKDGGDENRGDGP